MFRTGWCAQWKRNKEKSSGEARLYPRKQKTQGAGRWDFIFTKYPLNQREHDLVKVVNWPDNGSPEKRLSTRGHRENGRIKRKKKKRRGVKKSEKDRRRRREQRENFYSILFHGNRTLSLRFIKFLRNDQTNFRYFRFPLTCTPTLLSRFST